MKCKKLQLGALFKPKEVLHTDASAYVKQSKPVEQDLRPTWRLVNLLVNFDGSTQ